jgi:hypothetical protein
LAAAWAGDLAMTRAELARVEGDAAARVRSWRSAADSHSPDLLSYLQTLA